MDTVKIDNSVQARFGKRWFRNTFTNLISLKENREQPQRISKAIVTAAGPSLEKVVHELRQQQGKIPIIATDTSFPALIANDINPDYVVSIDCQQISYRHFMTSMPSHTVFLHELASPPTVFRSNKKSIPIAGNHPLSRLISHSVRSFIELDTIRWKCNADSYRFFNEAWRKRDYSLRCRLFIS